MHEIPTRVVYLKEDGRRAVIAASAFDAALHSDKAPEAKQADDGKGKKKDEK